jgi:hypothetical protein
VLVRSRTTQAVRSATTVIKGISGSRYGVRWIAPYRETIVVAQTLEDGSFEYLSMSFVGGTYDVVARA